MLQVWKMQAKLHAAYMELLSRQKAAMITDQTTPLLIVLHYEVHVGSL